MVHIRNVFSSGESPLGNSTVCLWASKNGGTGNCISRQILIQHGPLARESQCWTFLVEADPDYKCKIKPHAQFQILPTCIAFSLKRNTSHPGGGLRLRKQASYVSGSSWNLKIHRAPPQGYISSKDFWRRNLSYLPICLQVMQRAPWLQLS